MTKKRRRQPIKVVARQGHQPGDGLVDETRQSV
jgi:hypothetical protein